MESELLALARFLLLTIPLALSACTFLILPAHPTIRAAVLAFLVYANSVIPWSFSRQNERLACSLSFALLTWYANSRLLALVSGNPKASLLVAYRNGMGSSVKGVLWVWVIYGFCPLVLRDPSTHYLQTRKQLTKQGKSYIGLFVMKQALVPLVIAGANSMSHGVVKDVLWGVFLFLWASSMMDLYGGVAGLCGVPCKSHFNSPFIACSLMELWSYRWNQSTGAVLREGVYEPSVRLGCSRALSVLLTFAVSGIAHETLMFIASGVWSFEWLTFFALQGVLCCVETLLPLHHLPRLLRWALTMFLIICPAHYIFLPPFYRAGLDSSATSTFYTSIRDFILRIPEHP